MTKARTIANLGTGFVNISDSGTAGTKVASGTTAQRGSTAGQIRFNTTTGLAEYYTGTEFKVLDTPPTVTVVSPLLVDSNAGGNITFTITGSNFQSGATVKFIGNDATEIIASTTTVNSSSSISAVIARSSFVNAKEPYDVRVLNTSGLSGTLDNQIYVDTTVAWSTASGSLGTLAYNASGTHYTLSATDADSDTITYSVLSGTLPTGLSLNSSTGVISGTLNNTGGISVSTFTIRASTTDANADRAFSITVGGAPYSVDFLVVAGGGSGGQSYGAGGGAGGYRTSTQTVNVGTAITVTVGDGGATSALVNYSVFTGNSGSNSSISGSGLTTITSTGGGGGGGSGNGASGGSGGGASDDIYTGGSGNTPSTSPSQGNNGGNASGAPYYGAGGGGGSGAVGVTGTGTVGGNGGAGTASSITGSSVTRAGGGGGGTYFGGTVGTGGSGGGGNAGVSGGGAGTNGTANTGGGGGGVSVGANGSYGVFNAGSGGKGVVILSVPTARYSGTTTGSPTVTTKNSGADTVLTFNGSGSYTG